MPKIIRGGIEYTGGDSALSDLRDVSINSPTTSQVLAYNGSNWVNAAAPSGSSSLSGLSDVDISSPSNGDVLKYDSINQEWVNASGGGGSSDPHITLTQAEYDALVQAGTVDPTAFYFISDAVFPSYAHDYSANEQIVGTWIDGSPVYEKTIQATPTTGDYTIDISALNIDVVVDLWGVSKQSISTGRYHCIRVPYCYDANDRALMYYQTDTGYLKLVGSNANINNDWHITIQYTKSSS